jgi:hypothetical protein
LTFASSTLTAPNINLPSGGKYKIDGTNLSYNDLTNKLTALAGGGITISANNEISSSSTSQWLNNTATGTTTRIYYNQNNVGIGTANPTNKLSIYHSSTAVNAYASGDVGLFVFNNATTAGQNSVITNMIGGPNANKVIYSLGVVGGSAWSMYMLGNSDSLRFNPTIDATLTRDALVITNSGTIGIGIATPLATLHVTGTGTGNNNGNIIATGDITAYYSDERLKTKISTINNPLSIVNKLNGFYYRPNEIATKYGINNNKLEIGLSAQDVQKVLPELVKLAPFDMKMNEAGDIISKSGEKYLTISYERIVPVLVEAIKELNQKNISFTNENNTTIKIDEHRAIINSLEERIKHLETKITKILNHINI